jgi:hypothetical protein
MLRIPSMIWIPMRMIMMMKVFHRFFGTKWFFGGWWYRH